MKFLQPRYSIFTMLVLIALVAAGMAAWQQWVMWPAMQDHLRELILVDRPSSDIREQVQRLVRRNPRLVQEPLLMTWAVRHGSVDFCEDLLDAGRDPREFESVAPLIYWSARAGRIDMVEFLLDRGADVNQLTSEDHYSPLTVAASMGNMPMCVTLVEHGANVNHTSKTGQQVLHAAVNSTNYELVEYLLRSGATYGAPYDRPTPLEYAIIRRNHASFYGPYRDKFAEIVRILAVRFPDEAETLELEGAL
ncbi:ankyrin repeat domain-containing protein [Bremerella cremea]|uniref:Uncharacterized protein n=1 Tax=Blastopirellula marina TaxID=124 RepID=A0A2S8FZA8_9BACT|nr:MULTISPECIES: ankyrin repeat domain-containing protein [Pirellulaceae]PQO37518.1 hypothetical protein C5Y83_06125 [Blastopirellula marina]RCS49905.1 ankyrin repeat domain-containing protein [Bremerella cremea]